MTPYKLAHLRREASRLARHRYYLSESGNGTPACSHGSPMSPGHQRPDEGMPARDTATAQAVRREMAETEPPEGTNARISSLKGVRRGPDSNRRITVLQTAA